MYEYEYVEPFLFIENEKLSSLPCRLKNDNISNPISQSYLYSAIVRIKAVITIKIYSVVRIEILYLYSSVSKLEFYLYDFPFARQKTLQYAEAEFLNIFATKVLRVLLLAIQRHLC